MADAQISSIEQALVLCRRSFIAVGAFSFFINVLTLTPMFYMINVRMGKPICHLSCIAQTIYLALCGCEDSAGVVRNLILYDCGERVA